MGFFSNLFSAKGVLGINARNLLYIRPYNPKKAIKLADDKIKTKQFLAVRGIPVPKLYAIIKEPGEIDKFDFNTLPNSFVLKPNKGFGGEGIIPILRRDNNDFIASGGKRITREEMKDQIRDILDGRYSISNVSDYAFFEQHIFADERVGKYSYEGLPDIRVIVHNLIPVMAMLRLPTKESEGKANLHMGAVGVGIDIAKGETTYITYKNKIVDELPDGLGKIRGMKLPFWDQILEIASKVQLLTNLGYMAIDLCIDKNSGPVLLEINARAGLGVQIANLAPLRKRLERIQGIKVTSPTKGVRIAKDLFGNVVEKEIAVVSGKQLISPRENIDIIQKKGTIRLLAKVDTSRKISVLDEETALKNGLLEDMDNYDDEKSTLKINFSMKGKRVKTIVELEKISDKDSKMILGLRDLKDFLINPIMEQEKKEVKVENKEKNEIKTSPTPRNNFFEADQKLIQIDSKIKLLYHLRPVNLESERDSFLKNPEKNPQFVYPKLKFDPYELRDEIIKLKFDDSILGQLFQAKKQEIENKISLLELRDEPEFSDISIRLFGKPEDEEIENCKKYLLENKNKNQVTDDILLNAEEAKLEFEKVFKHYGLINWKVKIKDNLVSDCIAGKNDSLFVSSSARISKSRMKSLIVHEIETHILTAENGKLQPYEIFNRGLADYLVTQEGMAMYNVEQQKQRPFFNNFKVMSNVIAIYESLEKPFAEVFKILLGLDLSKEQAFRSTLKAKRGYVDTGKKGAFTKDCVYYKGYVQVRDFIHSGGKMEDLYIGKINLRDLEEIKGLSGIKLPKYLPDWLKK